MNIALLALIYFTSLTGIISAVDEDSQPHGNSRLCVNSSKLNEDLDPLDSLRMKWVPILDQLEAENRRLKLQLAQKGGMFPNAPFLALNLDVSNQLPKVCYVNQDSSYSLNEETSVAFVDRIFANLKKWGSILTDLEQENLVIKHQLSEYDKELEHIQAISPRRFPPIETDRNNFDVPYELFLPLVPDDDREKKRPQAFFKGENFLLYDVSGLSTNCAFNVLDLPREKVIKEFKPPVKLVNEMSFVRSGTSICAPLLPHIGAQLLQVNVLVLIGFPGYELVIDGFAEKEYAEVEKNDWPTFYIFYDGTLGHYQILVPQNDTIENKLLRRYARKKEDLRIEAIQILNTPIIGAHDINIEEAAYASLIDLQFLNSGKGGWLQTYVAWVKSRKGQ